MLHYYLQSYAKSFDFQGRARRAEYWTCRFIDFFLFLFFNTSILMMGVVSGVISIGRQGNISYNDSAISGLVAIIMVATLFIEILWGLSRFFANISLTIRRMHDAGYSGWFYLLGLFLKLFPPLGFIMFLVFGLIEGEVGDNKYGPDPKEEEEDYDDDE